MKRLVALAAVAVLAAGIATTSASSAEPKMSEGDGNLIITDASTYDYPGAPNPVVVCVDGQDAQIMEAGDQYFVEEPAPGSVEVTVFNNDSASCSDTPDHSITVPLIDGGLQGLLIGWSGLATFTYNTDCVEAGNARVLVAQGADFGNGTAVDVYGFSDDSGDLVPLAKSLEPSTVSDIVDIPAGTYNIEVFAAGATTDGPPLAELGADDLAEGTSNQVFLAGGNDGDAGGFTFQQGPEVCPDEEPPTTPTTVTTSTTTTTAAVAPGTATPATPISGTATFTG
jgi:hypothetical protein